MTTCTDPLFYAQAKFDTRYIANNDLDSTTQVNEWVIQNRSGVQETLNSLPQYTKFVPNAQDVKQPIVYKFQWRKTIPYSLSCPAKMSENINNMNKVNSLTGYGGGGYKGIWITQCSMLPLMLVYLVATSICFYKGQTCFTRVGVKCT